MNTDKLRELALAATEGPWESQGLYIYTGYPDASGVLDAEIIGKTEHPMKTGRKNAAYIAAANPVAILELLEALKEIGDDVKELRSKFYHYGNVAWGKDKPDVTEAYNICGDQLESILDKLCAS